MSSSERPAAAAHGHGSRHPGGQATTEYLILGTLIGLVLVLGDPSPLETLVRAIQQVYGRYTMALSLP
jgi:hypothetical protein